MTTARLSYHGFLSNDQAKLEVWVCIVVDISCEPGPGLSAVNGIWEVH